MILVTCALPAESSAFVRELGGARTSGLVVHGEIRGKRIAILHTGVGAVSCRERLEKFLRQEEKPRVILGGGFCGATNDRLAPGSVVIGESSAPELKRIAQDSLAEAAAGIIFSAEKVIDSAGERYAIGREHGAIAVDMETETIARICRERAIPFLALRAVSDSPGAPFPAPPTVLFDVKAQRTKLLRLFGYLMRHPTAVPRLIQFAKRVRLARERLAEALLVIVRSL